MWPRDEDGNWDGGDGCSTVPSIVVELTWEELVYLESVAKNFRGKKAAVSSTPGHTLFHTWLLLSWRCLWCSIRALPRPPEDGWGSGFG